MTDNPLVSIVIPCYNSEEYLEESIRSALGQTYRAVEVIVVDDGSTDGSAQIARQFSDRVRLIQQPNSGACAARNLGLKAATGTFIQFLDADDVLYPQKLERQMAVAGKDRVLVFCDVEYMQAGERHPHHIRIDSTHDAVLFMLQGGLPTPASLHRVDWLKQIGGFREDLPCAQERDLHLRIAASGVPFVRLPEVLCGIRRVPGSVSSNVGRVLKQHLRIVEPVFQQLMDAGQLSEERRMGFAKLLAQDARRLYLLGERDAAREFFKTATCYHGSTGNQVAFSGVSKVVSRMIGPMSTLFLQTKFMNLCTLLHRGVVRQGG